MNIVCGDALGVSCGTWIAFWNGSVGAFVGAFVSIVVALIVVELTRRHQDRHAAEAREIQALAEVVAQLQSVPFQIREGTFDSDQAYLGIESAVVRLELSSAEMQPVVAELNAWSHTVALLGIAAQDLNRTGSPIAGEAKTSVMAATSGAAIALRSWSAIDHGGRDQALAKIRDLGADMEDALHNARSAGLVAGLLNSRRKPRPRVSQARIGGSRRRVS